MSIPQPKFSITSSPPASDMAFGGEMPGCRLPETYGHHLNFPMPTPTTENHQLRVGQYFVFPGTKYAWDTNQVHHDPGMPVSIQVNHIRTPHNPELWSPSGVQPFVGVSSTLPLPIAVNEKGNHIASAFYPAYDPDQNVTHWDGLGPPRSLWPTSEQQLLTPFVDGDTSTLRYHFLDQPGTHPSLTCSSHATHSHHSGLSDDKNTIDPFVPHHSAPHQSISPTSRHCSPHQTSTGFSETVPHSHLPFYRVPHRSSTRSSRRRRAARAIEYDGLWVDEEELFRALTKPDGKFNVHQCHWEEDHSPCHLWITGDKSSINAHILKWHGGKPVGDKLRVNCSWSTCGKTMQKESIARHIVSIHLGEVWECQGCGKEITRNDAYGLHSVRSTSEACRNAGALITYSADAWEINARVALGGGRRVRYAGA